MIDDWHQRIELEIPFDRWLLLPPFAGFKSEYFGGKAVWTPRPRTYNAVLDFNTIDLATLFYDSSNVHLPQVTLRAVTDSDWDLLADPFAAAFHRTPPFCTLPEPARLDAAVDCLTHTRNGGDGKFLPDASVVAFDSDNGAALGAILVTRWKHETFGPKYDPSTAAHITWAFVRPLDCGLGVGSRMLSESVQKLQQAGFRHLLTTFLAGNESSMLWHWRNGFRLLPYPASRRGMRNA